MDRIELILDKVFSEHFGKNKIIFENYRKIYGLDTVVSESVVSKKLFEYCLRKKHFILLLLYDEEGKIFLDRNMSDTLNWGLPGGSVKDNETIASAVDRISKSVNSKVKISDVEPVTLIQNIFKFQNREFVHEGIGFIARVTNINEIDKGALVGSFITIRKEELNFINRLASRKVVELFTDKYEDFVTKTNSDFQDYEISANLEYKKRYKIHKKYMKRFILTDKAKKKDEYKQIISNEIDGYKSIIDVSCGDDDFIFKLAREKSFDLVVGNDISWSQVEDSNSDFEEVIFTNHNSVTLPFMENTFEISYCSNTLHHMPNKKSLINMMNSMYKISKKMIIVEIEDPTINRGFPRLLNKYWYTKYLGDAGGAYLSENQFQVIINQSFNKRAKIRFDSFENIMGKYLIAIIDKEEENV